ncbi:MAG: NAD-dependent epimerase/dehydratase family protein [Ignavibacteria bacterium]|jgi:UDP-2-acetamido-2,6-beta-L-arabino-hexul-4-ose reductase
MIKVGITGQAGFIGTHLYNFFSLKENIFELIDFNDKDFEDLNTLKKFVTNCDCIIHLAALNRHNKPEEIYTKNVELVDKLITALEESGSKAHVIFSSSTQEDRDNLYGRSKKQGRQKLAEWARNNKNGFTGLIIPNVFGPFGKPFYNSVISTFSYQLVNNDVPRIEIDADLKLIYINELATIIENKIKNNIGTFEDSFIVLHSFSTNVTGILNKLNSFKSLYLEQGIIPPLESSFDINLFNTFRSYIDLKKLLPFKYKMHTDERGSFVELIKIHSGGQISFSTTKPGIIRGNHFHTRKIERFIVLNGDALVQLRKKGTSEIFSFKLSGKEPSFIDIPVWYTHNIINIGNDELVTLFWINEFYNAEDPDTFYEPV